MNKTKIEWVRNPDGSQGYTCNVFTGCLGPDGTPQKPERCPYCFAHQLAKGRLKQCYLSDPPYPFDPPVPLLTADPHDPFTPRFWRHRLREPFWRKKPATIFLCSMSDPFGKYIPISWKISLLNVVRDVPRHTFLVLTKNPSGFPRYPTLPNLWLGVTVNYFTDWDRLSLLQSCNTKHRFVSFEPLLSDAMVGPNRSLLPELDWIIIGAQTKPYEPPRIGWVNRIVHEATCLGIPVFLKNNLKPLLGENLRQEFPKELCP